MTPGLSVCLKPGIVMERRTVWMVVMNSSVRCPVDLLRFPARVENSASTVKISATGPPIAGMLQMRVLTIVVIRNAGKTSET